MALKLNRRALLKGVGGAAVGLPLLECMMRVNATTHAQPAMAPVRYAIVFAGQSIGGDGWEKNRFMVGGVRSMEEGHFIAPAQVGAGYTMTTPLEPLADLKSEYSIVSNMRIPFSGSSADPSAVPAGGAYRDFHGGGASPLLSGMRSDRANFTAWGITSDQVIANMHSGQTTHESLVLRAQPSWYLTGSSYAGRQYISYRGAQDPIEAQSSPRIAYQALFGSFVPDDDGAAARLDFELRSRRSVLDLVKGKRERLLGKVGRYDRERLERHFDEIRDLEQRIAAIPPTVGGECVVPTDPGEDPPIGGNNAGSGSDTIQPGTGYSNEHERARAMADLIHMAFVCDLSRVASLMFGEWKSYLNMAPAIGYPHDLHALTHFGGDGTGIGPQSDSLAWHMKHFARLIRKLADTNDPDGVPIVDRTVLTMVFEGGVGFDPEGGDQSTHSTENMIVLVAGGRALGLTPGRHIRGNGSHPAAVLLAAAQACGVTEPLGDISEPFSGL